MELPISTTIVQVQCPVIRFKLGVTTHPDKDATPPAHPS